MDEFLPEVNKSKEIKSVCNNYEAPVPIYLSYGNMKENVFINLLLFFFNRVVLYFYYLSQVMHKL